MKSVAGFKISYLKEIPWEDRINVDNWPSKAGMYLDDENTGLCLRLIDYYVGSIEPRHIHAGMHATTVLKGKAIVDGLTLGPFDVILGPSHEPHGPLSYPEGCILLSAFQGSYYHSEVQQLSGKKEYRLIHQSALEWHEVEEGVKVKTLVDHGCGKLIVNVVHVAPGKVSPVMTSKNLNAALIISGGVEIEDQKLGVWDFFSVMNDKPHGPIHFPRGAQLLTFNLPRFG